MDQSEKNENPDASKLESTEKVQDLLYQINQKNRKRSQKRQQRRNSPSQE